MKKELCIEAAAQNIEKVIAFIDEQLEACNCPKKTQSQIDIAADEIMSNITRCAYPEGTGDVVIQIEINEEPGKICITYMDRGIPFNPLEAGEADVTLPLEQRRIGGLGIFMVKSLMDQMSYRYEDGKNILTLEKCFCLKNNIIKKEKDDDN